MQPTALKMQRKTLSDIVWPGGQIQGRTKKFITVAEKFYPRIKAGTIFFLTVVRGVAKPGSARAWVQSI